MKISRDSWHYKLLVDDFMFLDGWYEYNISNSLCIYFWQVVWRLVQGMGVALLATSPVVFWIFESSGYLPSSAFLKVLLVTGGLASGVAFAFGGGWLVVTAVNKLGELLPSKPLKIEPDKPNLVVEYIKAKKEKVCPMLEFTDE